ncbi:MAG: hypothetical protein COA32_00335 [Fluviicola sp.]|nr:MAG: hypothetical protein COA32_00335 [Fluviicola sp.]
MKRLLTIIFIFAASFLFSQQIKNSGLFQQNISFFNPSATAYQTKHYATIIYDEKLSTFPGNPTTFIAQYEKNLEKINSGIGILMANENIGFAKYNIGMFQYRYTLKTGEESRILVGTSAGVFHSKFPDIIIISNSNDTLEGGSQGKFTMNIGASYQWKNLYAGISALNVTKPLFDRLNYNSAIHYVAHANYVFNVSDKFKISPQAKLMTELVQLSATFNLRFEHYNKFWYLAGVRNVKSFLFGAGVQFWDRLYIGYLYEHFTNFLGKYGPSHEAFVTFKINN